MTATLDRPSSAATTVTVSVAPESPAEAGDYTLSTNLELTVPAGATTSTGEVTITAVDNDVDAPDKTVTVSATATNAQGITDPRDVTLTITDDDDTPAVTLVLTPATISENGGKSTVTATLDRPSSESTTVTVSVTPESPAVPGDYTLSTNLDLTIAAGATTSTGLVTITAMDNTVDAPNKEVTVSATATNDREITAPNDTTLTITDDDDTPTVSLVLTPDTIGEAGGKSTVTATLDRPSSESTTVTVSVTPESPAVEGDYTLSTNLDLTFAAGETASTGLVTVTAVNNTVNAPDKEVTVSATATNDQGIMAPDDATLTITDDDGAPTVSIADAGSVEEGGTLEFPVRLSHPSAGEVTVAYTLTGTATENDDYTDSGSGTLTFAEGSEQETISLTTVDDTADEVDETVEVTLTDDDDPAYDLGTPSEATGTITDDDLPVVTVASDDNVTEGEDAVFILTREGVLSDELAVTFVVTGGDAVLRAAPPTGATFGANEDTVRVPLATEDDDTDEVDATLTLTLDDGEAYDLGTSSSATADRERGVRSPAPDDPGTQSAATVTVQDDDDTPKVTLVLTPASISENGGMSTVTATLDHASIADTTVTVSVTPVPPAVEGDYTRSPNRVLMIAAGETTSTGEVTITAVDNDVDAPDKTVTVSATAENTHGITPPDDATLTITDDDDEPTVTLVLTPASISENGGTSTVTATLDRASSAKTTVTVSVTPVTPAVEGDYTLSTNRDLTIAAGETTSTGLVTVTAENNNVDAPDKEVTVSATVVNTRGITSPQDVTLTITDDEDAPTATIADAGSVEEGGTLEFPVSLSHPSAASVTVSYTLGGTATVVDDYTDSGSGTLTFAEGSEQETISLATVDDTVDEADETVEVTLTDDDDLAYDLGTPSEAMGTGTITDNDDTPTVTLVLTPASIGENGEKSTVTATLDRASSAETTVTVSVTPVTPAVAGDYTLSDNLELTVPAHSLTSTGEVTITAVNNDVDAADKMVTVSATAENTQGVTAPQDATLTITDDDAPELSIGDASVAEGDADESATLTFTVTLSPAATLPVTVDWATSDGTAEAGTDYTAGNDSLRFETGDESKTITVTVTGDDADEPNETLTVTLSNESGATLGDATGTGTITDDDDAPTVTLVLTPASIGENGGTSTVTATLDRASSAATTVTVSAVPVAPAVAGDYTLSTNLTLTIPAHSLTSTGEVTITAVNNDVDALDKEVTVSATATNSQGVTAPQDATLTITDDDAPSLSIGDASVAEGDAGESATLTFTVTLTPAATLPVTVDWATADGTATAGTDYTAGNGSLRFDTGENSKTITVTVTGDDADEPNETLTVTLSNAPGATLADATGTGTITDDDDASTVTLVLTPASIGENGGKSTVTATLDHPSSAETTVTVSAAPVDPAVEGDYTLSTDTTLTIAAGQTTSTGVVTITAVDNDVDALDKTVTVSATATNDQGITAPRDATLTITDDDAPELSIGDASVTEGDAGTSATLTFTVTLSPAATLPVTVDWATSDGTAEAGTDYTAGNDSLRFETGDESKTITVTVTGDDADEPNETLTVTLSNESGATLGDATGTGTITDDDDAPEVTLVLTPASIGEDGGTSTVTATLDRPSSASTTVTVSAAPVSPAVSGDYTLSPNLR